VRNLNLGTATLSLLSACAVGPDYRRPDTPVDPSFANIDQQGFTQDNPVQAYWTAFQDPLLDALVDDAIAYNYDLKVATANLQAARATSRVAGFDQYPTVTFATRYTDIRIPAQAIPAFSGVPASAQHFDLASVEFDALWELDLFGRVRRNVEAARADTEGVEAVLQDARVSIIAEVARSYIVLRGLQDQLLLTERNADNQLRTLELTRILLRVGRGNELDTVRSESQWAATRASIPLLQAAIETTMYRLSVLTGRQPTVLNAHLSPVAPLPMLPALTSIGTPEQLLRRRPDIRVAERQLAAATAPIGVAVGDLFPKVSFSGTFGYLAPNFGALGDDAGFYFFGPKISWAAFDLGRVLTRLDSSKAQTQAALASYQGAVLSALEDTERALISSGRARARAEALQVAAAASDRAADLARERFKGGLVDFLEVLDAERTALSAELALSQSRTDAATSLVAVYKALGGGW
jgi:outer membrane protein, multidrug efflux system